MCADGSQCGLLLGIEGSGLGGVPVESLDGSAVTLEVDGLPMLANVIGFDDKPCPEQEPPSYLLTKTYATAVDASIVVR